MFVHRPEVFRWQHEAAEGRVNMVVAADDDSGALVGVLGFIPTGHFDRALGDHDLALAIWKIDERHAPPGVGLQLLKFLQREVRPRLIVAIGTSEMVRPIYRVLGYTQGVMAHAALFDPARLDSLSIADVPPSSRVRVPTASETAVALRRLDETPDETLEEAILAAGEFITPPKSLAYVHQRYVEHPWFDYEVRSVVVAGETVGAIVWRVVEAAGSRVLRVVDVVGDASWIEHGTTALLAEIRAADAEYLDIVHHGLDTSALLRAGFVDRASDPELIIPNYFAPFERRNVDLWFAFRADAPDRVRFFRADTDQDRPNSAAEVDRPLTPDTSGAGRR